jgi:hypothetical protein
MSAPSTTPADSAAALPPTWPAIPPLENGDRLSRAEFERRYVAMPNLKKAELIEGVVYMPSPVRFDRHGEQHLSLICWAGTYMAFTKGVRAADNASARLNEENEPQPDVSLFIESASDSMAHVDDEGYLAGSPDMLGEVASSSVSIDLGAKFRAYRAAGVREYIVWRVLDNALDWFVLRGTDYVRLVPGSDGILRSERLPGLWLDSAALLGGNLPRVLEVVHQGLQSPEHAQFVAKPRPA